MPINKWIDKKRCGTYTNGILFSHQKGGYPRLCDIMYGPWAYYAKQDKLDKDKDYKMLLTCGI